MRFTEQDERKVVEKRVPASVKLASENFQMHRIAEKMTGLDDFSLEKIALYLGGRVVARNAKWRPVADGLVALKSLQG